MRSCIKAWVCLVRSCIEAWVCQVVDHIAIHLLGIYLGGIHPGTCPDGCLPGIRPGIYLDRCLLGIRPGICPVDVRRSGICPDEQSVRGIGHPDSVLAAILRVWKSCAVHHG